MRISFIYGSCAYTDQGSVSATTIYRCSLCQSKL